MRRFRGLAAVLAAAIVVLAGCGSTEEKDDTAGSADSSVFPVTIEHVYGETVIEKKPERIATVAWANHEVPLALGVVPVGMSKAAWGDDDDNGVLPWVEDKLTELGAETPVLFDEADGIDFEAVADTAPDVILASYSGLTQEEYDTLSEIAPVVAYPEVAWGTSWEDMVRYNSKAIGLEAEGDELIDELHAHIDEVMEKNSQLKGASVLFTYIDPADMSQIGFYTSHDTRPGFMESIGMTMPAVVVDESKASTEFYTSISAEKADLLDDVDVLVTYGNPDGSTLAALQKDPLLSTIPAIKNGAVAVLADSTPLAASANPSPLSIPATLDEYLGLLAAAVDKNG